MFFKMLPIAFTVVMVSVPYHAEGAHLYRELNAGQSYTIESDFNRWEVLCTAKPQTPTIVLKTCGCTGVPEGYGVYSFRLQQTAVLSDGKTLAPLPLLDRIKTLEECKETMITEPWSSQCVQ